MTQPKLILALGAGVQSTTVLLMSCKGELPKLDGAIFSDTHWEPPSVYAHFEKLKEEAARGGIPIHLVSQGNLHTDNITASVGGVKSKGQRYAALPLFVKQPDGKKGMIRRQCTYEYKIRPMHRKIRELVGLKPRQRAPKDQVLVHQWFGISADEPSRMRMSEHPWICFKYPLIYDLPKRMHRDDCYAWLRRNGWGDTPRSACIGCPFHSNHEWRHLRENEPEAWAQALEFDETIRHRDKMNGEVFLHQRLIPLGEVDIDSPEDKGQLGLWDNECGGMCGV